MSRRRCPRGIPTQGLGLLMSAHMVGINLGVALASEYRESLPSLRRPVPGQGLRHPGTALGRCHGSSVLPFPGPQQGSRQGCQLPGGQGQGQLATASA